MSEEHLSFFFGVLKWNFETVETSTESSHFDWQEFVFCFVFSDDEHQ